MCFTYRTEEKRQEQIQETPKEEEIQRNIETGERSQENKTPTDVESLKNEDTTDGKPADDNQQPVEDQQQANAQEEDQQNTNQDVEDHQNTNQEVEEQQNTNQVEEQQNTNQPDEDEQKNTQMDGEEDPNIHQEEEQAKDEVLVKETPAKEEEVRKATVVATSDAAANPRSQISRKISDMKKQRDGRGLHSKAAGAEGRPRTGHTHRSHTLVPAKVSATEEVIRGNVTVDCPSTAKIVRIFTSSTFTGKTFLVSSEILS